MRIMFVCHGNICRSPMAEFIMKKLVAERGLSDKFYISSSATSTEEIWQGVGNPIYTPAKNELTRNGVEYDRNKRAVRLKEEDYENYDIFVGMDSRNIINMKRMLNGDRDSKVHRLLDFTGRVGEDVADPWYSGDFETTYNDIYLGCSCLLEKIVRNDDMR